MNGSMAKGSKRTSPMVPAAAAVFSELMMEPRNVPCCQSNASVTRGTLVARRPPKRMAEIGTPLGSSHSGAMEGHCDAGAVKRALGWAAGTPDSGVQSLPFQSMRCDGVSSVMPSHHTSPSSVLATLVKMQFSVSDAMALALVFSPVPGATPKKPCSGLMAYSRPSSPNFIHAMSSPTVSHFQPGRVGMSIAMLVLPQAEGNAAAMYFFSPSGFVTPTMS